ncbi:DNMT3A [Symbiodinium sp. CCMP2592]|nr:DNMT3A [Symbiodinium sp. CCMP2592]
MFHLSCPHERTSFASLVHVLGSLDLHAALEPLRARGVKSASELENTPKTQLRLWIGDTAVDKLFNRSVVRTRARADAPVVHPYQRGSRSAAASVQSESALALADVAFQEDKFAKTSRGPRESRWKLWCSLAEQRNLPPLPVTVELIDKVGALLKQARYRSAAQYYSVAKGEHRAQGHDWSPALDHAVAQAVRSITRGMGPSAAKLDFPLEACSRQFDSDIEAAYARLQVPSAARIDYPSDTGLVAAWFLLRGLEISSVLCEDVSFSREGIVRLNLPISKTDPTARGCHRSHACICSRTHDPGCGRSGDEALLFTPLQQCNCSLGRNPLCAYHAALRCSIRLRKQGRWSSKSPFFGDGSGPPTKAQVVWLARVFAWVLCAGDLHEWPRQVLQRWAQHAFRVAGAQLFARADLDLHVIMLLGRWGSAAIYRYVQEAALANPSRASQAVALRTSAVPPGSQAPRSGHLALLPAALDQIRAVVADCFRGQGVLVHNVRSKLAHKPFASECSTPSDKWRSACGLWNLKHQPPRDLTHPQIHRNRSPAMATTATFDELCDKAAVHPTVRLLFKARGVDVPGVVHHLFSDRSKIQAFLDPLRTGVELAGDTKKRSADELLIDQATVLELLDVIAATKTAASPAAPAAPAASTTSTSSSEKSQELPAGYWNDFVTEYEAAVVDGRNRKFPAHLLVGSEKTLGRMVAEKKSGLYTALALGEILFSRHFTASKQVNPFSSTTKPETSTKLFASEDGTLSKVAKTIPEPQRLVTMLDAFEACKFAFMFARWGPNPEVAVADYFAFWEDLTRDNPSKFGQIRLYWKKASWEMAMALRSGKTFAQAAAEVTSPQAKQDAMSRWVPAERPFKGNEKGGEKGKKGERALAKATDGDSNNPVKHDPSVACSLPVTAGSVLAASSHTGVSLRPKGVSLPHRPTRDSSDRFSLIPGNRLGPQVPSRCSSQVQTARSQFAPRRVGEGTQHQASTSDPSAASPQAKPPFPPPPPAPGRSRGTGAGDSSTQSRTPVVLTPNSSTQASMSHVTPPKQVPQYASQPRVAPQPDTAQQALQPHVAPPNTHSQPPASPAPLPTQQPRFPVAVLSFFDGIATALHAVKSWAIRPVLSWSWELDPEAIKVASSQHPEMIHHGDVFGRKPHEVLAALSASVPKDTVVLLFAAPPCHDFSRIRSDPPGTQGHEGSKFTKFAAWLLEFVQSSSFRVLFLVENVHMSASQQQELDKALNCRAFACDASSWGVVSRPRLWWSNAVCPPLENIREPPVALGGQARWRRLNRHWELLPNSTLFPRQVAQSCPFATFSEEVVSGRIRFPCLTTPAENTQGREPPGKKRRSESPGTMERWRAASRSYPPWQFRTHALVKVAGKKDLPDPATREWLQLLPSGYTAAVSPHARARLLGNAWHAGVARLLVLMVLCQAGVMDAHPVRATEWYPHVPDPCFQVRWHPDGSRPLQRVASWWLRSSLRWDPNEPQADELRSPGLGATAHAQRAQLLTFADIFPAPLNPCLAWTFQVQARLGLKVVQVREAVLRDLQDLVAELQDDQTEALQTLPAHVASVYKQGSTQLRFQLLPLAWLLELCQFPGRSELLTELFWGFRLLGPVVRGSGWLNRDDAKYARPLSKQDFLVANRKLAVTLRQPSRQPEHNDPMLAELEKERDLGRVQGPLPLSLLGTEQEPSSIQVARGFAVVQNDKVRRADDWLRSLHNSTISAADTPPYLGGPTVVGGALQCSETFDEPVLLGAIDHEGAYRSLPVREPTECGLVMPGESPSLWAHNALPFGSVGSVWAYLRVADVVSFLTITLLLMFAAHYVDDFFSLERSRTALSGFAVFQAFHRVLGFRMKEEKSKEPRFAQTLLGIEWTLTAEAILASPGARRVEKLVQTINEFLSRGRISASECSQLTGKLCFTCTWVFNHVGRMLLQPLYQRQHHGSPGSSPLTPRLQQALHQLRDLLPRLQPRRFAVNPDERSRPVAHLYADAFLTVHGVRRVANKWLPELPPAQELRTATNGFGAIVFLPGRRPLGFRGEALAQLMSLAVVCNLFDTHVCCWIDNTAAEHALNKGYSKDLRLSAVIGAFWVWAASRSLSVSFHRVSSEENISDGISRGDLGDLQSANGEFHEVSFKEVWPLLEHFRDDCRSYYEEFAQLVEVLATQLR